MPPESALPPATLAAYVALALQDLIDKLSRNELPVPPQVRELAALYRGWARPGGAAADLHALVEERPRLVTYAEAARLLGHISTKTVQRLVASGALPGVHIGAAARIHIDDLDQYLDRLRSEPLDSAGLERTNAAPSPGREHAGPVEHDRGGPGDEDGDADRAA